MAPWNKDVFPLMSTFAEGMSEILGLGLSGLSRKLFSPYLPPPRAPPSFPSPSSGPASLCLLIGRVINIGPTGPSHSYKAYL